MNASTSTFLNVLTWTVKISGGISMFILSSIAILILGVILGKIEPNGSTIEVVAQYIMTTPWLSITMIVLAILATIMFWRKK
jgi:hypothetical protein